jgi:hypothetical protein
VTLELKISLISALAALVSAYWAWSSARIARRALAIAEEDAITKRESIKPYLINSLRWRDESESTYASFACTYTNGSSSPNTIDKIELIVHAFNASGRADQILLTPTQSTPKNSEFLPLPVPLNINSRTTVSGWLTFRLPTSAIRDLVIDRYEVSATTASGGRISLDTYLIMDQRSENEN